MGKNTQEVRRLLSERSWQELNKALAQAKHSAAGARLPDREFIEAVLWVARTGSPWRDVPPVFGKWYSVHARFQRWEQRGVWRQLWQILQREEFAGAPQLFLDSTSVRAHQHAAPKKTAATRLWDAAA